MAFFRKLFQSSNKSKQKDYPNIIQSVDPLESWKKVGELGDGAFGKVFKVSLSGFNVAEGPLAGSSQPIRDSPSKQEYQYGWNDPPCLVPNLYGNTIGTADITQHVWDGTSRMFSRVTGWYQ